MGQAFHRKQISIGRVPKTQGTGIKYMEVVPPATRELTAEEIAAREAEQQQQAALEEQHRIRQGSINTFVGVAEKMLRLWKAATDYNDQLLVEFPGWADSNFCLLPVDEDVVRIARVYKEEIVRHTRRAGRQLSLDEADEIIDQVFRNERIFPTEQIVEEASKAVRYTAEKCFDDSGICIERFIQTLTRRSVRAKYNNNDLDSALNFVSKRVASIVSRP